MRQQRRYRRVRGTTAELDETARQLRRELTTAEQVLWECLRDHRLGGLGFRRQHAVGRFILDFACPARMLAIEVDGSIHHDQRDQDAVRTEILEDFGWTVNRFSNDEVLNALPAVRKHILETATSLPKPR